MAITEKTVIRTLGGVDSSAKSFNVYGVDIPLNTVTEIIARITRFASLKFPAGVITLHPNEVDDFILYECCSHVLTEIMGLVSRRTDKASTNVDAIKEARDRFDKLSREIFLLLPSGQFATADLQAADVTSRVGLDYSGSKSDAPPTM